MLYRSLVSLVLYSLAALSLAQAQQKEQTYEPSVGQEGKDVIWVPTPDALVEKMLQMAGTNAKDYVIDLGSGDGKIPITAAKKFGSRGLGIEYNPDMVALSNRSALKEGVASKVKFIKADIFETDFSQASVLTLYLLPELNLKLRPKILDMKPGTRVVSHQFRMGDWEPDEQATVDGKDAYFWVVPAKVEGKWRIQMEGAKTADELSVKQTFQVIQGSLKNGSKVLQLRDAKLRGDTISFTVGEGKAKQVFSGRINGQAIEGIAKLSGGNEQRFSAVR